MNRAIDIFVVCVCACRSFNALNDARKNNQMIVKRARNINMTLRAYYDITYTQRALRCANFINHKNFCRTAHA